MRTSFFEQNLVNSHLIVDPTKKLDGLCFQGKNWVTLIRFRSNMRKCKSILKKIGNNKLCKEILQFH